MLILKALLGLHICRQYKSHAFTAATSKQYQTLRMYHFRDLMLISPLPRAQKVHRSVQEGVNKEMDTYSCSWMCFGSPIDLREVHSFHNGGEFLPHQV